MEKKEYKKSYWGLIWLFIIYFVVLTGAVFLPYSAKIMTLVTMNISTIWFVTLTFVIYKTEKIYWYTGLFYEDVKDLPSEVRREYGRKYVVRFAWFALFYLVYSAVSYWQNLSIAVDVTVMCVGVVAVAISTMGIKLE